MFHPPEPPPPTLPFPERQCSLCDRPESSFPVSFLPCHSCRIAYYCCDLHRKRGISTHNCSHTISSNASFSRNCYLRKSQPKEHLNDASTSISVLDDQRRKQLLEEAYKRILAAQSRTEEIHAQIRTWNPDIASNFELKPAPFSEAPLRVLHSSWDLLEDITGKGTTAFVALSYCWRSKEWEAIAEPHRPSTRSSGEDGAIGVDIPICKCLWDFLLGLLESDEEAIWVDQLCLVQDDDKEKRSAVASMDALYASARLVFVAIEDMFLSFDEATLLTDAFRQVAEDHDWTFTAAMASKVFMVVKKIFSARWFHRAWCFHEYHLSGNRVLAIPVQKEPGSAALSAVGLYNLGEFVFRLAYFQNESVRNQYADLIKQMLEFFGGQDYAFSNIIANTFHYGSKHREDKLSIALNICQLDLRIKEASVTYDEAKLYLLILALAAGDATILTTRGEKVRYGQKLQCTSWLNWPNETSWSTRHPFPLPKGITSLTLDYVVMDLFFIPHAALQTPSYGALRRARQFLKSDLSGHIRLAYNLQEKGTKYELDEGTLTTLACALDCGLLWMMRAWDRIEDEVTAEVDQSYQTIKHYQARVLRFLFSFHPSPADEGEDRTGALKKLGRKTLAIPIHGQRVHDREVAQKFLRRCRSAFRMVLCILLFGRFWEMNTRMLLGPGSQSQMGISDLHSLPDAFRVPIPSEHKLYSKVKYSEHPKGETALAIPRVLAGRRFGMSDRLWSLEPLIESDSRLSWRVKEKVCVLGCGDILADGVYVVQARRQRVVG